MRETKFLDQNKDKWSKFENILNSKKKDPEQLSSLFTEITDDLSYSRTFYPNRSVRIYLNNIAQRVFHSIYKTKKLKTKSFIAFWTQELPQVIYSARIEFRIALVVFLFSIGLGMLSNAYDPEFPRIILGDTYVDMTQANIESGDPMAVYKKMNEVDMFLGITFNNLLVAFRTFVFGAFFAIGSLAILLYNGIMVGTFQYFFIDQGLFRESFLTIWMHGTLEISSIIIAGAAGIVMGRGLIAPGTYTRLQSFRIAARKGLKIMAGIVPVLILAALIESFITRFTEIPDIIRFLFIAVSFVFVMGYFVWYPMAKARKGFVRPFEEEHLPPQQVLNISLKPVKGNGEIFRETFLVYKSFFGKIFPWAFVGSILYSVMMWMAKPNEIWNGLFYDGWYSWRLTDFFNYNLTTWLIFPNVLLFSIIISITLFSFKTSLTNNSLLAVKSGFKQLQQFLKIHYLKILVVSVFINTLFLIPGEAGWLLVFSILPFFLIWIAVSVINEAGLIISLRNTFNLTSRLFWKFFGSYLILMVLSFIFFLLLNSPILWLYFEVLKWNIIDTMIDPYTIYMLFVCLIMILGLLLTLPILLIGSAIQYYNLREIREAHFLLHDIKQVHHIKSVRGLEMEE